MYPDIAWLAYLREVNILSITVRVILAMITGGLLGLDRGHLNRPAGFRTYMLVCLGATIVMTTNQYVYQFYGVSDPTRLGAQVISGIGFLGAGSIIITGRSQVKGLTTAAGMWATACAGLAIGTGFYEAAVIGMMAIIVIMTVLRIPDSAIKARAQHVELYIEFDEKTPFSKFLEYAKVNNVTAADIHISKNKQLKGSGLIIVLMVRSQSSHTHAELLEMLSKGPGVVFMEKME